MDSKTAIDIDKLKRLAVSATARPTNTESEIAINNLVIALQTYNELKKAYNIAKLKRLTAIAAARQNDIQAQQNNIHTLCQSLYLRQIGFHKICIKHKYIQANQYDEMKIDI